MCQGPGVYTVGAQQLCTPVVLSLGDFAPQGTFSNVWRHG